MKNLSHQDLQDIISALEILHGDINPQTLADRTLKTVMTLIPNEITAFDGFGTDNNYSGNLWYSPPETVSEERILVLSELVHEHPAFPKIISQKLQKTFKVSQYMPLSQFQKTALYNEFYRFIGGDSQMATTLNVSKELYVTCSLHRRKTDFTDRDLEVLKILSPHFASVFRNAQFIHKLTNENELFNTILEITKQGVIIMDSNLTKNYISFNAQKILENYFSSNQLPSEIFEYVKHFSLILNSQEIYLPPNPLIIEFPSVKLKITLSYQTLAKTIAILMEEIKEITPKDLVKLGLTKRESEILYWMAKGKTDLDISKIFSISRRTVHKHRENIFNKLNVENRTTAIAKINEMLSFC